MQNSVLNALSNSTRESNIRHSRTRSDAESVASEESLHRSSDISSISLPSSRQLSFSTSHSLHNPILIELMADNEANGHCAECGAKAAEWVVAPLKTPRGLELDNKRTTEYGKKEMEVSSEKELKLTIECFS